MTTEEAPSQDTFSITFPQESGHSANSAAASLGEAIRDIDPSLSVTRQKSNPNSQDAGSVLMIVLGSAPAAAIGAGIAAWIRMHRLAVRITTKDRSIEVSGSSADAAHVIESIFKRG